MEITLTKICSKIKELKPNNTYKLKYTGLFCHMAAVSGLNGIISYGEIISESEWMFINRINTGMGEYGPTNDKKYILFQRQICYV